MCEHIEDGLDRIINDMLNETHDPTDPNEIASAQRVTNVLIARNAIRQKHAKIRRSGSVSTKFINDTMPYPVCKTGYGIISFQITLTVIYMANVRIMNQTVV